MANKRKAARYGNTKAANIKLLQNHFIKSAERVKLEVIRLAAWLRMAWG